MYTLQRLLAIVGLVILGIVYNILVFNQDIIQKLIEVMSVLVIKTPQWGQIIFCGVLGAVTAMWALSAHNSYIANGRSWRTQIFVWAWNQRIGESIMLPVLIIAASVLFFMVFFSEVFILAYIGVIAMEVGFWIAILFPIKWGLVWLVRNFVR